MVVQDVTKLDDDERILLVARVRDGLGWASGDVLGVLEKPGQVRLLPWAASRNVLERRSQLLLRVADAANRAQEDLYSLRALDDRFCRLIVRDDGRVRLHAALRLHLHAGLRDVVVVRFPDGIELWSPEYRNKQNQDAAREFSDLV